MSSRGAIVVLLAIAAIAVGAESVRFSLEETWTDSGFQRRSFEKIVVIGISDDRETRHRFEDKFVSHLRGRGIQSATSYSIVVDLTVPQDKKKIVQTIGEQGIDGAISVRVIPMKQLDKAGWAAEWREQVEVDGDLRELIDETLPLEKKKSKKYGVEVALWETGQWDRVWGGRTDTYTRDQLRKGSGDLVQHVMDTLTYADLLEPGGQP